MKGQKFGGRKKGTLNKKTIERLKRIEYLESKLPKDDGTPTPIEKLNYSELKAKGLQAVDLILRRVVREAVFGEVARENIQNLKDCLQMIQVLGEQEKKILIDDQVIELDKKEAA